MQEVISKEKMEPYTIYIYIDDEGYFNAKGRADKGDCYALRTDKIGGRNHVISAVRNNLAVVKLHGAEKLEDCYSGKFDPKIPKDLRFPVIRL